MRGKKRKRKRPPSKSCYRQPLTAFRTVRESGRTSEEVTEAEGRVLGGSQSWLLLRSAPNGRKQKAPQTLTGRVWIYDDSLRTKAGYIFLWQSSQESKVFQRSNREGAVCGCGQGKVLLTLIDTVFQEKALKVKLIHLVFILLQQKTRRNLPKEWLPKVSW